MKLVDREKITQQAKTKCPFCGEMTKFSAGSADNKCDHCKQTFSLLDTEREVLTL